MKKSTVFISALVLAGIIQSADAKEFRVAQIPNGSVNKCLNCHTSMTSSSRNAYGKVVQSGYLNGENVVWGAALAKLDSDGDGFTNGTELQDPNGTWTIGATDPGNSANVSIPGVKTSVPPTGVEELLNYDFSVTTPSPNPFITNTSINYNLNVDGMVFIAVYDVNGRIVKNLIWQNQSAGEQRIVWDGTDNSSNRAPSGKYFISISMNGKSINKAIEYVK